MIDPTTGFSDVKSRYSVPSSGISGSADQANLIWVTSFNRELYEHSGKKLIQTFANSGVRGDLLITYEGMGDGFEKEVLTSVQGPIGNRIRFHVLDFDHTLHSWLSRNRDIIPRHLGGKAVQCSCPGGDNLAPSQKHVKSLCHWTWWNRNCSRWFRKIPSINAAILTRKRYVAWIDCDCSFTPEAWSMRIPELIGEGAGFYLKGPRKIPECGILCYDMDSDYAKETIRLVKYKYDSGAFRQLQRWDDSFVWWVCMQDAMRVHQDGQRFTDLAKGVSIRDGHVVSASRIGQYVVHNKGEHARKGLGA